MADWARIGKVGLGVAADFLTFGGGLLLARDAFHHQDDLRREQLEIAFRLRFPSLAEIMEDGREDAVAQAGKMAWRGFWVLLVGFVCQVTTRFLD